MAQKLLQMSKGLSGLQLTLGQTWRQDGIYGPAMRYFSLGKEIHKIRPWKQASVSYVAQSRKPGGWLLHHRL